MRRLAVFASGTGSNYQAIMEFLTKQTEPAYEVSLLVCDQSQAGVLEKARYYGTPTYVVRRKDFVSKEAFEQAILDRLQTEQIEFLVLAGYMRLLGSTLLNAYPGRIINIHPSLLPAFAGKAAIEQAICYGVRVTGVTIHFVDEGMDTGPIIYQYPVFVDFDDNVETLSQKIHQVEHQLYPRIIQAVSQGQVSLVNNRVFWQSRFCFGEDVENWGGR